MLTCLPKGICSWNYRIYRKDTLFAELDFDSTAQHATIRAEGQLYDIVKVAQFTSDLQLVIGDDILAMARDMTVVKLLFEIKADRYSFELIKPSILSRKYQLVDGSRVLGWIAPFHSATRRVCVEIDDEVPQPLQLFAFAVTAWLRRPAALVGR